MKNFKKISVIIMMICFMMITMITLLKEKETYSDSERRVLASFPEVTTDKVLSGQFSKEFEEYTTDVFPYRDMWRSIKANVVHSIFQQKDHHNLYYVDDHLAKMEYEIQTPMIEYAKNLIKKVKETYLNHHKIYMSLIPDKHYYLAKENQYPSYDVKQMEDMFQEALPFVEMISIDHLLDKDDYYKTDSHWKQERIMDVAKFIASAMGKTLNDEYDIKQVEKDFYGVYYGQAALNVPPDHIQYVISDTISQLEVDGAKGIYDYSKLEGKDMYEFFLSGNQPIVTIKNPLQKDASRLVVFRDSYACSFVPLLAEAYSEIVLVDLRYIRSDMLNDYVSFDDADILFMYSTSMMNASTALK